MRRMNYRVRIWLDATEEHTVKYKDSVYVVKKSTSEGPVWLDIPASTVETYGTMGWENDMINAVLDSFKGTDMGIIEKIDY